MGLSCKNDCIFVVPTFDVKSLSLHPLFVFPTFRPAGVSFDEKVETFAKALPNPLLWASLSFSFEGGMFLNVQLARDI